jgi:HK97 family phage portal protein
VGLFTRAIRPPDVPETPNGNDPASVPPATVGPPNARPGDPHGVELVGDPGPPWIPPVIRPSAWSGWPAEWATPNWGNGQVQNLTDTAWACLDLNSSVLATMPPYLVGAAPSLNADWLTNPDPDIYTSVEEFLRQLFWDYQAVGEAFVIATAWYSTSWPARFHVAPPWTVNVEMDQGRRIYSIGDRDVTDQILHIRYLSSVSDAHGHGPLEAGAGRLIAAQVLARYATELASNGGVPPSVLEYPVEAGELTPDQAALLKAQWVQARMSSIGEPAVLSGGVTWKPTQVNPADMALLDLSTFNESRIAVILGVPPHLVGLPSGGDSMTYANVSAIFDYHWRAGLRPKAQTVMAALSGWLLPRGTRVELNRDEYVQPGPYERAQTAQILNGLVDPATGQPALSVAEIRQAERLDETAPRDLTAGVLR